MKNISYIYGMDLHQMATLLAVAEEGTLSAAARKRHLTQPAVSMQLKALEEELGVVLFERRGRSARPTQAGLTVLRRAREALSAVEAARAEVSELRGLVRGSLRLGATDAAAVEILPEAFVRFHQSYPGIEVSVEVHATAELLERLLSGRVDLALGTLPITHPDVHSTALLTERLGLVAPVAWKGRSLADLLAVEPFIAYPKGSVSRELVDRVLESHGATARAVMEIGQPTVSARLVAAGFGISVLPETVVTPLVREGTVVRVASRTLFVPRELGLLEARRRVPEPAARAFAALLRGDAS